MQLVRGRATRTGLSLIQTLHCLRPFESSRQSSILVRVRFVLPPPQAAHFRMAILIDGYNLLFASGIFGAERGERGGESSRRALLEFLAEVLPAAELPRTTIVFDAAEAPPGLPREFTHERIRVLFAPRKTEADELLERLIEQERDPRKLTVVSSDHRVQRAARRRRAAYIDSDVWYAEKVRERRQRDAPAREETKPERALDDQEVASWLREFGLPPPKRPSQP